MHGGTNIIVGKADSVPLVSSMQMPCFYLWLTDLSQIGLGNHFMKWKQTGLNGKTKRWSKTHLL